MEPQEFMADPQKLVSEASNEPSRRGLQDYAAAILLLKDEKGFSFREIAAWLRDRGITVDHNAVWRAYSKSTEATAGYMRVEQNKHFEQSGSGDGAMTWM